MTLMKTQTCGVLWQCPFVAKTSVWRSVSRQACSPVRMPLGRINVSCKAASKDTNGLESLTKSLLPNILIASPDDIVDETLKMAGKDPNGGGGGGGNAVIKRILRELSSLPRSIAVLGIIAFLSSLGTIIEQGKSQSFYMENYPDAPQKVIGFLTYEWILNLELDHIYTAWYFWFFLLTLAAQLTACTYTRQFPLLKVARQWNFPKGPGTIAKLDNAETLPGADLRDLGQSLRQSGYEVFMKNASMYAFKGLAGRIAPIGVHVSMLIALAGMTWGIVGGFKGTAMVPVGADFQIEKALSPTSPFGWMPSSAKNFVEVDGFNIDYDDDGVVSQFYSDLSVYDPVGNMVAQKKISVNDPIRVQGITMYQSDWSMAAMELTAKGCPLQPEDGSALKLRMALLKDQGGVKGRAWATFVPTGGVGKSGRPAGVSVLARDFQAVVLYDSTGAFAGVRRIASKKPIVVDGMEIVVDKIIGSTGLELKSDPGVPLVYAGFGGMMLTTMLSYLSHSQIWAIQAGTAVQVGGRTNRAKEEFKNEMSDILDRVPEKLINDSSLPSEQV